MAKVDIANNINPLTEQQETECLSVIETIIDHANQIQKHNQAIGALLWRLKYHLLGEGRLISKNFHSKMESLFEKKHLKLSNISDRVSFNEMCKILNDLGLFESVQSLYNRVWAYEQKLFVEQVLEVDISGLKISDHTFRELRKVPEQHQKEVLETAILDISKDCKQITARSIQLAREVVFNKEIELPYVKLPEKKIPIQRIQPAQITLTSKELDDLRQQAINEYKTTYQEELIGLKITARETAKKEARIELEEEMRYLKRQYEIVCTRLQLALAEIEDMKNLSQIQLAS